MRLRKTIDELNELEWEILHAVQDCRKKGASWTGRDFLSRLPHRNPETVRRVRNLLVADGLIARANAPRWARGGEVPAPCPGRVAAESANMEKSAENHYNKKYPVYETEIPDIIDDMSEPILDNLSPSDACRIITKRWANEFGGAGGVS